MKKNLTILSLLVLLCNFFYEVAATECSTQLGVGYRLDSLNWNIAGPNNHPNVLSELKWFDINIWEIRGSSDILLCQSIYLKCEADYGKIFHGKNRDSDYFLDHRRGEFSHTTAKASKGEVFDFSGAAGYQLAFFCNKLFLIPLVGYSQHEQHLRMYKAIQKIDIFDSYLGKIYGLHSNYRAKWYSPWIGIDAKYEYHRQFTLKGGFEYHWACYRGTGHWNLRYFPKDFQHKGIGEGIVTKLEGDFHVCNRWNLGFILKYQDWRVFHGHDYTYFYSSSNFVSSSSSKKKYSKIVTKLNQVNWHSLSVTLNGELRF